MSTEPVKRIGRPPLAPEDKLSEPLQTKVTRAEADALWREALRQRIPLAELLRKAALSVIPKTQ